MKDQILTGLISCALPASLVWEVKTDEKAVFITFDDGPIPELTEEILDILSQYKAKATFFCVGENVLRYRDVYSKILHRGHSAGNHTHRHLKGWTTSFNDYLDDVSEAGNVIHSNLFRPPYGLISYRQARAIAKEYKVIMWSVLTRDYDPSVSREECLQTAIQGVRPGSIIVFHDNIKAREKVLYALPRLLDYMAGKGYRSEKLSFVETETTMR